MFATSSLTVLLYNLQLVWSNTHMWFDCIHFDELFKLALWYTTIIKLPTTSINHIPEFENHIQFKMDHPYDKNGPQSHPAFN